MINGQVPMNLVPPPFTFHWTVEINWSFSGTTNDFVAYNCPTAQVSGYPAKKLAAVARQKIDDAPSVQVMNPVLDV